MEAVSVAFSIAEPTCIPGIPWFWKIVGMVAVHNDWNSGKFLEIAKIAKLCEFNIILRARKLTSKELLNLCRRESGGKSCPNSRYEQRKISSAFDIYQALLLVTSQMPLLFVWGPPTCRIRVNRNGGRYWHHRQPLWAHFVNFINFVLWKEAIGVCDKGGAQVEATQTREVSPETVRTICNGPMILHHDDRQGHRDIHVPMEAG